MARRAAAARRRGPAGRVLCALAILCMMAGARAWTAEHGFCELCIYAVHQVQYGQLPSCGGSAKSFSFSACSQVVQSMLAYAHDVMHLISYGCYRYDPYRGWQTVRPCPAHVICGRLVNVYDMEKASHCPADFHYRFPHALGNLSPQSRNPLLKYALDQFHNRNAPTMFSQPRGGVAEPSTHPTAAFPNPASASTVAGAPYAHYTAGRASDTVSVEHRNSPLPGNPPTAMSAELRQLVDKLVDERMAAESRGGHGRMDSAGPDRAAHTELTPGRDDDDGGGDDGGDEERGAGATSSTASTVTQPTSGGEMSVDTTPTVTQPTSGGEMSVDTTPTVTQPTSGGEMSVASASTVDSSVESEDDAIGVPAA